MNDKRQYVRRSDDRYLMHFSQKKKEILNIGQLIISEVDFGRLFNVIINQVKYIMEVERCSIFLIDKNREMLDAYFSAGMEDFQIRVPKSKGIAGWVFNNLEPAIVNEVYKDSRFYPDIDNEMSTKTQNIICVPLMNKNRQVFGVLEVVNKMSGNFDINDLELLTDLSNYVSIALENAQLIKEIRDKATALEKSEEKYRTILENIVDGYFEVDLGGNLTFFNDSMCHILGYTQDEMMGMNNRNYMSPETSKMVYETFNKVFTTQKATKGFGWELIRKDGEVRYVETSVSLINDLNGSPIGFRGITRDTTEIRAFEKAKEKVINHLSHELGTPISIINAGIEMLSNFIHKGNIEKSYSLCKRIDKNIKRLKELQ